MTTLGIRLAATALAAATSALLAGGPALAASREAVLYSFTGGTDGGGPTSALLPGAGGWLYGTTHFGGITTCGGNVGGGCGVVYGILLQGNGTYAESVIDAFGDGSDGGFPNAGLVSDAAGNMYGAASTGGNTVCSIGCGVVYELINDPSGWIPRTLYVFDGTGGQFPNATLSIVGSMLYGTTWYGGATGNGTVFSLAVSGSKPIETVLHSFSGGADGSSPAGGVAVDPSGTLFGTTYPYNGSNDGVVYALAPAKHGWKNTVLHAFTGASSSGGENPYASVIEDAHGNLYGTTIEGGASGAGVVYELARGKHGAYTETVLHTFAGADGASPYAGLIADAHGNLYGTTVFGGAENQGCVYELKRAKGGYSERVLYSFTGGADGANPSAPLLIGTDGKLYGTASGGGTYSEGVVFAVTP